MIHRLDEELHTSSSDRDVRQGTLLSWGQYLDHIEQGNYEDARHRPHGSLTHSDGSSQREERSEISEPAA
ncbi:MAG: hypothetical protein KF722_15675 [Nitrospira sp.]|nr:hypothetical protein [Nitrospira sp.]